MKTIILAMCLAVLSSCSHKEEPVHHEVQHLLPPPPEPVPVATNPFEKPPQLPAHEPFRKPHWEQADEFKMNGDWSIWTWRDVANHNTCYLYNIVSGGRLVGHGMSCVKE